MLLASNLVFTFFSQPFIEMLPGFVKEVLGGGPEMLGTMVSVLSLGALSTTLFIASMRARNRGRTVLLGNAALGVVLIGFAFSPSAWLTWGPS
jgi:cyanate permease